MISILGIERMCHPSQAVRIPRLIIISILDADARHGRVLPPHHRALRLNALHIQEPIVQRASADSVITAANCPRTVGGTCGITTGSSTDKEVKVSRECGTLQTHNLDTLDAVPVL